MTRPSPDTVRNTNCYKDLRRETTSQTRLFALPPPEVGNNSRLSIFITIRSSSFCLGPGDQDGINRTPRKPRKGKDTASVTRGTLRGGGGWRTLSGSLPWNPFGKLKFLERERPRARHSLPREGATFRSKFITRWHRLDLYDCVSMILLKNEGERFDLFNGKVRHHRAWRGLKWPGLVGQFFSFWFLINYVGEISLNRLVYLIGHTFGYLIKLLMLTQCDNN